MAEETCVWNEIAATEMKCEGLKRWSNCSTPALARPPPWGEGETFFTLEEPGIYDSTRVICFVF